MNSCMQEIPRIVEAERCTVYIIDEKELISIQADENIRLPLGKQPFIDEQKIYIYY